MRFSLIVSKRSDRVSNLRFMKVNWMIIGSRYYFPIERTAIFSSEASVKCTRDETNGRTI